LPRSSSAKASADARLEPSPTPARGGPWYGRLPWWAIAITLLVVVSAPMAVAPIRDAATLEPVSEAHLAIPPGYLAIAPVSNVLDTLTLLTVPQHIAVVLTVIVLFGLYRVGRARRGSTTAAREVVAAAIFLAVILAVYGAAAVLPRPMAQLEVTDETVLAVDFHSHTKYSHDGRSGWTEDDVRDWHRAAGYAAAYITDHASYEGAERGIAANPGQAGEGTMLLQGLEAFYRGEHVNVLGAGRRYRGLTTPDLKDVDEQSLALASMFPPAVPVLVETIPGHLDKVPVLGTNAPGAPAAGGGRGGVLAIEIIDGSPRGLTQGRRDRGRIVRLADSLNLALVTGSDNHGWGNTAPGWTLLRIPGWRGMTTDSLSQVIEQVIRKGRRESTRPVERRVAETQSALALVFAAPIIVLSMFTTLSADERIMWLLWAWGIVVIGIAVRRYRSQRMAGRKPA
jgi:hypothetical protein